MAQRPSVFDYVNNVTTEATRLFSGIRELAKAEIRPSAKHAGIGAGMLGAAAVIGIGMLWLLLFMVGLGCIAFVYSGTYHGAMEKLLEEGDYSRDNKGRRKVIGTISAAYWLIVTAVFLVMMFSPNTPMMPRESTARCNSISG